MAAECVLPSVCERFARKGLILTMVFFAIAPAGVVAPDASSNTISNLC